jgi:hypothetical protein
MCKYLIKSLFSPLTGSLPGSNLNFSLLGRGIPRTEMRDTRSV